MNPQLIQSAPCGQGVPCPLVLIHDGGGNCVPYFSLPPLGRKVFGIRLYFCCHSPLGVMQYTVPARRPILPFRLDPTADGADITDNPRRSSARTQPWKGGLEELAAVYIELLRTVVGSGPVLLGGWSFGGVVAVEMSRQLVLLGELAGIVVEGLILIDTVYPEKSHDGGPSVKMFGPSMTRETKRELLRSFAASAALLDGWKPSPLPHVAHPRAVLLRASDWVSQKAIARVDVRRNAFLLGWEKYAHSFIDMVLNVAGHHYAVFDKEHLQDLGAAIRHACLVLER